VGCHPFSLGNQHLTYRRPSESELGFVTHIFTKKYLCGRSPPRKGKSRSLVGFASIHLWVTIRRQLSEESSHQVLKGFTQRTPPAQPLHCELCIKIMVRSIRIAFEPPVKTSHQCWSSDPDFAGQDACQDFGEPTHWSRIICQHASELRSYPPAFDPHKNEANRNLTEKTEKSKELKRGWFCRFSLQLPLLPQARH